MPVYIFNLPSHAFPSGIQLIAERIDENISAQISISQSDGKFNVTYTVETPLNEESLSKLSGVGWLLSTKAEEPVEIQDEEYTGELDETIDINLLSQTYNVAKQTVLRLIAAGATVDNIDDVCDYFAGLRKVEIGGEKEKIVQPTVEAYIKVLTEIDFDIEDLHSIYAIYDSRNANNSGQANRSLYEALRRHQNNDY